MDFKQLRLKDLAQISTRFGLSKSPAKALQIGQIKKFIESSKQLINFERVVSIDVGYKCFGWADFDTSRLELYPGSHRFDDKNYLEKAIPVNSKSKNIFGRESAKPALMLKEWNVVTANLSTEYNLAQYTSQCINLLMDHGVFKDTRTLYLIEKQSLRPAGFGRSIPHAIIKLIAFEAILYGILSERGMRSASLIQVISPRSVSNHFELGAVLDEELRQKPDKTKQYQSKKKQSAQLIQNRFLDSKSVLIPLELRQRFQNAKKKDDYSDSLLNGLAFFDWIKAASQYCPSS